MASFPVGVSRAPSLLMSQASLARIAQTNLALYRLTGQLSSGIAITRPGDDAVKSAAISLLDSRVERSNRRQSNLNYADDALNTLDQSLSEATDMLNEAKSLALQQMNTGTTAEERADQAIVVQSYLDSIYRLANRESVVGHIFGGSRPGDAPVEAFHGGFRFVGERGGLYTDLGTLRNVPITLGADNVIGSMSARVQGSVDLDPELTEDTRIADLQGARGAGITLGTVKASFSGDEQFDIDLAGADTVGDVIDLISAAIAQYERDNNVTVLGPGGVSISGQSISIDIPDGELVFDDVKGGITGQDLGLVLVPEQGFDDGRALTPDLQPRIAWNTPLTALQALSEPLGTIRINNNGATALVDLSNAQTLDDVRSAIESTNLGVRCELNEDGTGFNVVSEVATGIHHGLSIEEVDGRSAEALGIRSMTLDTSLNLFNDGRGVQIVDGEIDPDTGLYDADRNVDMVITLGDGFEIPVDLRPEDVVNVGTVIDRINQQAQAALSDAGRPATQLLASLNATSNGITLTQADSINGAVTITPDNNSPAATQLGLVDGTWNDATGMLVGQDRATARPDNIFSHLIDFRDALNANDTFGIQLAAEKLDESLDRLSETRALVAGYAKRVQDESLREEDRQMLDVQMRSQLQDLDYASAASQFAQLQAQLQAGLQTTAQLSQLSLLDFLG